METKHTPGPLTTNGGRRILDAMGREIGQATSASNRDAAPQDLNREYADALLWAAAPDLLAACLDALQAADEVDIECPNAEGLRAAIAKATGTTA